MVLSRTAMRNCQGSLGDSEDKSDAKIISAPVSETGRQSGPHIQLELMPKQPQQGNTDRVLVENNFDPTSVTWRDVTNLGRLADLCRFRSSE